MKNLIRQHQFGPKDKNEYKYVHQIDTAIVALKIWLGIDDAYATYGTQKLPYYSLFAYLFRRFGPPMSASDQDKDLARYTLTTSDPQVLVGILFSSDKFVIMHTYAEITLERACRQEEFGPMREHHEKFLQWAFEKYQFVEGDPSGNYSPEKLSILENQWAKFCASFNGNQEEIATKFWSNNSLLRQHYYDLYKAEFPMPCLILDMTDATHFPNCNRVYLAVYDLITELTRHVGIRDTSFNLLGESTTTPDWSEVAPEFQLAGHPVIFSKQKLKIYGTD